MLIWIHLLDFGEKKKLGNSFLVHIVVMVWCGDLFTHTHTHMVFVGGAALLPEHII